MNTESQRLRALLAAGAALVVFGITIPATASPDGSGGPADGSVGQAQHKANPKGQVDNDKNHGFTCDENGGVGNGNPALDPDCGGYDQVEEPGKTKGDNGKPSKGNGGYPDNGEGEWVPPAN